MLSIPKNLFYVIHRCGNLHKLAIWKLIFTAREVNGIQGSETLHALHWNWMMIMRNTDENTKIQIKHKYKYTLKPEGWLMGSRGMKPACSALELNGRMMIVRNTDRNTKIQIKHDYKYTTKPERS